MYIDSHAHFDLMMEDGSAAEDLLVKNMKAGPLSHAVQISTDVESSRWSLGFAIKHADSGMVCTLGIHPSTQADSASLRELEGIVAAGGGDARLIFGIGECGLDYYRMRVDKESQKSSFRFQIELANRFGLPLIVHSRDAMEDTLDILRGACKTIGIMHCFPGDAAAARRVLDMGFYISFAGNVTFPKAAALHESVKYVPLDRLLLETDAPFLAPVPLRGKKNRPEFVIHTYRFVSELRREPLEKIIDAVNKNFMEIRNHEAKKV